MSNYLNLDSVGHHHGAVRPSLIGRLDNSSCERVSDPVPNMGDIRMLLSAMWFHLEALLLLFVLLSLVFILGTKNCALECARQDVISIMGFYG